MLFSLKTHQKTSKNIFFPWLFPTNHRFPTGFSPVSGRLRLYTDTAHAEAQELREKLRQAEAQLAELTKAERSVLGWVVFFFFFLGGGGLFCLLFVWLLFYFSFLQRLLSFCGRLFFFFCFVFGRFVVWFLVFGCVCCIVWRILGVLVLAAIFPRDRKQP